MTLTILIGLWVGDELSFNHCFKNHDRIAQVMDTRSFNGETNTSEDIAIPLAEELKNKFPQDFKYSALVFHNYTHVLSASDKKISASGVWTQPQLPEMLTLEMSQGRRDALTDPSAALISKSLAKTLFGKDDPINQTIRVDNMAEVKVGGVFEDLPENCSFYETQIFLSWDKALSVLTWLKDFQGQWDARNWKLVVQVGDHANMGQLNSKIKGTAQLHIKDGKEELVLHPMNQWHLYGDFEHGKAVGGLVRYVWMFSIIGAFVLLLACVNFMNLSTARSSKRAKEVGVRKTIGSLRSQLIGQFLTESVLVAIIAFLLSIVLVGLSLPYFNNLTGKSILFPFSNAAFSILALSFAVLTGLLAGCYPAFYLSSFQPVKVLKGTFITGKGAALPRKVLVVLQFSLSIAVIIATVIIFKQIQFAKNRPVGYSREGLITVQMNTPELYHLPYHFLRSELLTTGAVENLAQSDIASTDVPFPVKVFNWPGKDPGSVPVMGISNVTHDYGKTIGWQITEGRDFSRSFATDSGSIIVNESAKKLMGISNPIGKMINWDGEAHPIVGVVKDMVMESPYRPVQPTMFTLKYDAVNIITIRMNPKMPVGDALQRIGQVFKKLNPEGPFEYKFIGEEYNRKFSNELRMGRIATCFSFFAIFISCLGLFGLASFVAEQRTKEIGIRKVLGASVVSIWGLVSKDFALLVFISILIAIPVAYYFMHHWLQNFPYHTVLSWWVFAMAGSGALVVTIVTVSFQALKAALINPVNSLRSE